MKTITNKGDCNHNSLFKKKTFHLLFLFFSFLALGENALAQNKGLEPGAQMNLYNAGLDSDWKVKIRVTNASYLMNCWGNDTYSWRFYRDNVNVNATKSTNGNFINEGDLFVVVAGKINSLRTYKLHYKTNGDQWSCLYWKESTIAIQTSPLKAPKYPVATDGSSSEALNNQIKVTWQKGTDVPDNLHNYYIVRDGDFDNKIFFDGDSLINNQGNWIDEDVNPDETHSYYIWSWVDDITYGQHQSDTVEAVGSTLPNFSASDGEFALNKIRISWPELNTELIRSITIRRDGVFVKLIGEDELEAGQLVYDDEIYIPGYKYNYTIEYRDVDNKDIATQTDTGYAKPNGVIAGTIKAPFGSEVIGAKVYVERIGDITQGEDQFIYSDTTDDQGHFRIPNIYYYTEADFKVYPEKGDHGFNPSSINVTLSIEDPKKESLAFTDTSSFTVQGKIVQVLAEDSAAVEDVEILVNDTFRGTKTDSEGNFSLTVEEIGSYTITPRFLEHEFDPPQETIQIESDITSVFFEDIEKDTLSGYFLGGCDIYIGQATLKVINSTNPTAAFDTLITTVEGTGYYEVILPSREYIVQLVDFVPESTLDLQKEDVINFFEESVVNLTEQSVQKDFIFRNPPEIEVVGFPEPGCAPFDVPIVEQLISYPLEINVFESFGEDRCLTDAGYVVIYDEVKDGYGGPDTLQLEGGIALYNLVPGEPNTIEGGAHPFQKKMDFHANVEGQKYDLEQYVLIEGNKPDSSTFATVSPELPFLILRDPPGDGSYSFLNRNTTLNSSMSFYAKYSDEYKFWNKTKLGAKTLQGMGVFLGQESYVELSQSMTVGTELKSQADFGLSISTHQDFKTSGNQDITGESGDVFIGSAMNIVYALTTIIDYDVEKCTVEKSRDIIIGNDGFATTFMYTESHISDVLIPDLQRIEQTYVEKGEDSTARAYRNRINVWEQTLQRNRDLKRNAIKVLNRSFSAGSDFTSSIETTVSLSTSIEFNLFIEQAVGSEVLLDIAGTGYSGGFDAKFRLDIGGSVSLGADYKRTVGFHFEDDEPGDFFSIDIKEDLVYGTPVFDLVSGRSSCPWEPGTQPREGVQLSIDKKVQYDIEPDGEAVFILNLGNTSQSDEDRTYSLIFLPESNPGFADVDWNGKGSADGIQIPIPSGGSVDQTFVVRKGPNASAYQDLKFALISECDAGLISDTVAFSVYFISNCSPISISKPKNNWLVNSLDDNKVMVEVSDYDLDNLNSIVLEYRNATGYWDIAAILEKSEMESPKTSIEWDITSLDDSSYDLRVRVACGENNGEYTFSEIVSGRIDRSAPELYGIPEPADGNFEDGDAISAIFDEELNCFNLSAANVILKDIKSGTIYQTGLGCYQNELNIIPLTEESFNDQVLEVSLIDIEDKYGNVRDDAITWDFNISNADFIIDETTDSDGDGILDKDDNCPYTPNKEQLDGDGDGIGDVCDDDIDGDGVANNEDNCPYFANADQADEDGDGIGDVCELDGDGDEDGVINEDDNCPSFANGNQDDMDNDGIGDACDDDLDGDGVLNELDNCLYTSNPDQEDEDNDGFGDACHTVTGLLDDLENLEVNLYPNPASEEVSIAFNLRDEGFVMINLHDISGKLVKEVLNDSLDMGKHKSSVNTSSLKKGIYLMHIQMDGSSQTKKLVIMK